MHPKKKIQKKSTVHRAEVTHIRSGNRSPQFRCNAINRTSRLSVREFRLCFFFCSSSLSTCKKMAANDHK